MSSARLSGGGVRAREAALGAARKAARGARGGRRVGWGRKRPRRAARVAARTGLAARGVLYVLVGVLALRIALGVGDEQADRGGALQQLVQQPFGAALVWALALGLAGMAVWRLSEAVFGSVGPGGRGVGHRLGSAARAVFYGVVAYSVFLFALGEGGSGSSDEQSRDVTARVLELPAGRWVVAAAGVGLVGAGVWIAIRAGVREFRDCLETGRMSEGVLRAVTVLGVVGGVCRGVVFAAAGGFAVSAAVRYDPEKAKGLDDTLRAFAQTPAGPWLLAVVACGLALFGVFSVALARWRRV